MFLTEGSMYAFSILSGVFAILAGLRQGFKMLVEILRYLDDVVHGNADVRFWRRTDGKISSRSELNKIRRLL